MRPFGDTYAQWLRDIGPAIAQRDLLTDLGTFGALILVLYVFEALSHRFVVAGGIGHKVLRLLLAPGVLVHEVGHYLLAILSGFRNVTLTMLPVSVRSAILH